VDNLRLKRGEKRKQHSRDTHRGPLEQDVEPLKADMDPDLTSERMEM
jgi:hypothetical protein